MDMKKLVNLRMGLMIAAVVLAVILALTSCSGGTNGKENGTQTEGDTASVTEAEAKPGDTETLIIGLSAPLSGELADFGTAYVNGASLACAEINGSGGIVLDGKPYTLLLSAKDDGGTDASGAVNSLIAEKAAFIIGPATSDALGSVEKLCNNEEVLLVSPSASFGKIDDRSDFVFRMGLSGDDIAEGAVRYMAAKNHKTAAVIYTESLYSRELRQEFRDECGDNGISIVCEISCEESAADYSGMFDEIAAAKADFVFLPLYAHSAANAVKELSAVGYMGDIIGGDGLEGLSGKLTETYAGSIYFMSGFNPESKEQNVTSFMETYTTQHGTPMSVSALAYDVVKAVVSAVEAAESDDPDQIRAALSKPEFAYSGLTGNLNFDEEGNGEHRKIEVIQLVMGKDGYTEKWVESVDI